MLQVFFKFYLVWVPVDIIGCTCRVSKIFLYYTVVLNVLGLPTLFYYTFNTHTLHNPLSY